MLKQLIRKYFSIQRGGYTFSLNFNSTKVFSLFFSLLFVNFTFILYFRQADLIIKKIFNNKKDKLN